MLHLEKTFKNFSLHFPGSKGNVIEHYGMYWIAQELLAQNKNSIPFDDFQIKLNEYCPSILSDDVIDYFLVEGGNVFSKFQREVQVNSTIAKAKRREAGELKQELERALALIKRLEQKIAFLKNPKPKLKRKILNEAN